MDKTITEFFKTSFIDYSSYDNYRKIASYIDGLKPSARKTICTVIQNKICKPMKVSNMMSKISEQQNYIHGEQSLFGVIVGLAQDFPGSNNLPLLKREGAFGTRAIQVAAASRYIFTCAEDYLKDIFCNDDSKILIDQEFEGDMIEPKFYVPVIPLILVNGSEGVSVGFAQKILSRNPKDIVHYIKLKLTGHKMQNASILPWFNGFNGVIVKTDSRSFEIRGKFERIRSNMIKITELPIGYDLRKYLDELDLLEEKGLIASYSDKSSDSLFEFHVKLGPDLASLDDEQLLDKLKLIRRIVENYTCTDENNKIIEFSEIFEIIDKYMDIRLDYYRKRKEYLSASLKNELRILVSRYVFITYVLDGKIIINNRSVENINSQLEKIKEISKIDEKYDYLLAMRIASMTKEKLAELKENIVKTKNYVRELETKTVEEIWISELNEFQKILK